MDAIHKILEGKIDFEGQRRVERISRIVLILATTIAFVIGFALQSLTVTFGTLGVSSVLLYLVVIPPWPTWRSHPVKWLPSARSQRKQ